MKLHEVLDAPQAQLNEGALRNIIAAASVVLASLPHTGNTPSLDAEHALAVVGKQHSAEDQFERLARAVASKYHVDSTIVQHTVHSALKHEYKDFPTAKDILAVVGTESSFNPKAKSHLSRDPARGLMQVRPNTWKMKPKELETIDSQIKTGAQILHRYYEILGNREAALQAYNVGLTNYKTKKVINPRYVPRVDQDMRLYDDGNI